MNHLVDYAIDAPNFIGCGNVCAYARWTECNLRNGISTVKISVSAFFLSNTQNQPENCRTIKNKQFHCLIGIIINNINIASPWWHPNAIRFRSCLKAILSRMHLPPKQCSIKKKSNRERCAWRAWHARSTKILCWLFIAEITQQK